MTQKEKFKLFISYSHKDSSYIENFIKHIAPLKNKNLIEDWYDRKILPGKDYQKKINNNLEEADIICLFISANFLNSSSCQKEVKKALKLKQEEGVEVVSIVLSHCGWKDIEEIAKFLVLPEDGNPISAYENKDKGFYEVYEGLKDVIKDIKGMRCAQVKKEFIDFLKDSEMLTKAHSQKEKVFLDDIFVYPELDTFNELRDYDDKISSEEIVENILKYPKFVVSGEDQSGKTTLAKKFFKSLRALHFFPIYIYEKDKFKGKMVNKIERCFYEQYDGIDLKKIEIDRIVPIIDDFHLAKNKEKHMRHLTKYKRNIIIVDDIFNLNIQDENLLGQFENFKIREYKPSLINILIKKWVTLTDKKSQRDFNYEDIDKNTELIESTLGKIIGKAIMPSYPFYILSALVVYKTFDMPINQEITSQGYCYQALIYFYLRKRGVRNEEIDIYINFLAELAFHLFKEKKVELPVDDFKIFMQNYKEKYNLPIKEKTLLKNLEYIILIDSFNNYSFRYLYFYYFFVAKYLTEHIKGKKIKDIIVNVMRNLHVDENAYIAIFMTHHSRDIDILEKLELNTRSLFNEYKPATLSKKETGFFDKQANIIIKEVLPPPTSTPEKEREKRLKIKDKEREQNKKKPKENTLGKELRRTIRTVEVIGCIIKNRAGSLEKTQLETLFKEALTVHLRVLDSFFELIKDRKNQAGMTNYISERLNKVIKKEKIQSDEDKVEKIARSIFWNLNYFVVCGIIDKIIHSLGSDKLLEITNKVCDDIKSPASFIVKHGILMWYKKNLQIKQIVERINSEDFSIIAERTMRFFVIQYCTLHTINYRDRKKIEHAFNLRPKALLKG